MVASWYKIWYHTTQVIFILLFVGFSVVVPLDCIVQASDSSNDAVNTFIVVGAAVVLVVFGISISFARVLIFRRSLQDIPKKYIPVTAQDMRHKPSREYVIEKMKRAGELAEKFKVPKEPVLHAGMEPKDSDMFPEHLKYAEIVKFISDRFRFDGALLLNFVTESDLSTTFKTALYKLFENEKHPYKQYLDEFISLYEKFRFSGQDIERNDFVKFLRLYKYLADLSNNLDLTRIESVPSQFLHVPTEDYDTDARSRTDSEFSAPYLRPYPSDAFMHNTTPASHVGSRSSNFSYDIDESAEPPESVEDQQRYHDMLTRVDTYNTVIHR
ncbi:Dlt1 [Kluyveromyces lactis]|nr:Dlt1 [Kluyveromyces lactis]